MKYIALSEKEMQEVAGGSVSAWGTLGMIVGFFECIAAGYQTVPYGYCEP